MAHTYFLTKKGQVFVCGNNDRKIKLGIKTQSEEINIPKEIKTLKKNKIIEISSLLDHTIAMNSMWDIMAWGRNKKHALGLYKKLGKKIILE